MVNIDETIDMLSEYDDLDEVGRCHLLDNLLDIIGDLKLKDTEEGWQYESNTILVNDKEEIPQPYTTMEMKSAISILPYRVSVKQISGIQRNDKGKLLVTFLGKRSKV